jgi:hypothetical protein
VSWNCFAVSPVGDAGVLDLGESDLGETVERAVEVGADQGGKVYSWMLMLSTGTRR